MTSRQFIRESSKGQPLETSRFIKPIDRHLANGDVTKPFLTPCHSSASTMFSLHHPFADPDAEEDIPLMTIAHDMPNSDSSQFHQGHVSNGCTGERMRVSSTGSDQSSSGQTPETADSLSSSTDEVMNVESHLDSMKNVFHANGFSLASSARQNSLSEPGRLNGLGGNIMTVINGLDNPLGDCMEATSLDSSDTGPVSLRGEFQNELTGPDSSTKVLGKNYPTHCEFSDSIDLSDLNKQPLGHQENLSCGKELADASVVLASDTGQVQRDNDIYDEDITMHSLEGESKRKKSIPHRTQGGNVNSTCMNTEKAAAFNAASHYPHQFATASPNTAASTASSSAWQQLQPSHSSSLNQETDTSIASSTRVRKDSLQEAPKSVPQQLNQAPPLFCPAHVYGFACSGPENGQLPAACHVVAFDPTWQPTAAFLCSSPFNYPNSNFNQQPNEDQPPVASKPVMNPSDFPFQLMIPASRTSTNPLPQYSNSQVLQTFVDNQSANLNKTDDLSTNDGPEGNLGQLLFPNAHAQETILPTKEQHPVSRNSDDTIRRESENHDSTNRHQTPILQVMVPRPKAASRQNHMGSTSRSNANTFAHEPWQIQDLHVKNPSQPQTLKDVEPAAIQRNQPINSRNFMNSDNSNQTLRFNDSPPNNPSYHQSCEGEEGPGTAIALPDTISGTYGNVDVPAYNHDQGQREAPSGVECERQNVKGVRVKNGDDCGMEFQTQSAETERLADSYGGDGVVPSQTRDLDNSAHQHRHFQPGEVIRVHESSFHDDYHIEMPLRPHSNDQQNSSISDVTDLKADGCCGASLPFCCPLPQVLPCHVHDHHVPDYTGLSLLTFLINPVIGALALLTNHLAKHYHRHRKFNHAQNLYMATIVLMSLAFYSAITIACVVTLLFPQCHLETAVEPDPSCPPNEDIMDFFGMDEELYCRNTKNEKVRSALMKAYSHPAEPHAEKDDDDDNSPSSKNCGNAATADPGGGPQSVNDSGYPLSPGGPQSVNDSDYPLSPGGPQSVNDSDYPLSPGGPQSVNDTGYPLIPDVNITLSSAYNDSKVGYNDTSSYHVMEPATEAANDNVTEYLEDPPPLK